MLGEVVEAFMVTVELPVGVLALVLTVNETATGVPASGLTELEGEKLQCAPLGKPLQDNCTVLRKEPKAVT